MGTHIATTPFGRRPVTLDQISNQARARKIDRDATVSKWQVFRDIREAKDALGATDRALAILNALLTFYREDDLTGEGSLVVFPSNEQLIRRANGMSPATLRRHISVLVACGLVIRRDSPNGKRFARKGQGGEIEQAYGFDLAPLVARAEEFKALADAAQARQKAFRLVKERLTLCRRDVVKMIEAGINGNVRGDWSGFLQRYEAIVGQLPRTAAYEVLEANANRLEDLWADVHQTLELFMDSQKMNANESQFERHIQNSNPNLNPNGEKEGPTGRLEEASAKAARPGNVRNLPNRDLPLGTVLSACPEIANYAPGRDIRTWRDLAAAVDKARPGMGISPTAWQDAIEVMGVTNAAITLAAILQRSDHIRSSGGYLRDLTERAREQKFSIWPMIMALLNTRMDTLAKAAGGGTSRTAEGEDETAPPSQPREMSEALRRNMKKKGW